MKGRGRNWLRIAREGFYASFTPVTSPCGGSAFLSYTPRRVICTLCGSIHVEAMPWVSGKRQFTRTLMVTLATWARVLTWKQVAKPFTASGVRWKLPSMKPWPTA